MQLTPNLKHGTRLKQESQNIIFLFYDFLNFFGFLFYIFRKTYRKKKIRNSKIFNKNSGNLSMLA